MEYKKSLPTGFATPTQLPASPEQHGNWQDSNRTWWESHPMRYDWHDGIQHQEFSREFFAEIDRRFFDAVRLYMPWRKIPFDALVDFGSLKTKDVLEIGCGNGSHAQLLATHSRSYTGIDLTDYAVGSTSRRLQAFGLPGSVRRMDAEAMNFADGSFDYIWTWGVIHHSANTRRILEKMRRVLKPGGLAMVMVYHRSWWTYYAMGALLAVMHGHLPSPAAIHDGVQVATDGALATYYTAAEWRRLVGDLFAVERTVIYGQKAELVFLPGGRFKDALLEVIPNSLSRWSSTRCHMGPFLVSHLRAS